MNAATNKNQEKNQIKNYWLKCLEVINSLLLKWVDPLIYNLLYPACFGNMIYELFFNKGEFHNPDIHFYNNPQFLCGLLIMLYYLIDYLHLYQDMNKIVRNKYRGGWYHLCDISVPILFFASFIYLERGEYLHSLIIIGLVPLFFLVYKIQNTKNYGNNKYILFLCALSATASMAFYPFANSFSESKYTLFMLGIETFAYALYVFCFYGKYWKKKDIQLYKPTRCHGCDCDSNDMYDFNDDRWK